MFHTGPQREPIGSGQFMWEADAPELGEEDSTRGSSKSRSRCSARFAMASGCSAKVYSARGGPAGALGFPTINEKRQPTDPMSLTAAGSASSNTAPSPG